MQSIQLTASELAVIENDPLYDWQIEALEAFCKGWPVALRAANGSGKTAKVAANAVRWFFREYPKGQMICTSGSFNQLLNQLWPNIRNRLPELYEMNTSAPLSIKGPEGSKGIGFSTNNAGRAEGWHPKLGPDIDPVMILVDEAKTVPDEIWTAFDRCTVKYSLFISSPGKPRGRFFECFHSLSEFFYQVVATSEMCPHIPEWKRKKDRKTMSDEDYNSCHNADFTMGGEYMIISPLELRNALETQPAEDTNGERVGFFDFARGGDENVFYKREGNKVRLVEAWRDRDSVQAVRKFIYLAKSHGLHASECWGDADGLGGPMIDIFKEEGYPINEFRGGMPANNSDKYGNLISEAWIKGCMMIEQGRINLGELDPITVAQLTNRLFLFNDKGKQIAEPKKKMAERGVKSPDRGDGLVGAIMCGSHMSGSIGGSTDVNSSGSEFQTGGLNF